jgi:hypothetical protein
MYVRKNLVAVDFSISDRGFLKLVSAADLSIKAKLNKRNNPSENTRKIGRMFRPMVPKVRTSDLPDGC